MPLRDHFHAPLKDAYGWESFHSGWVNTIVRTLNDKTLPPEYRAAPHTKLGVFVEADVATFERTSFDAAAPSGGNGVSVAAWAPPQPTRRVAVALPEQDVFEVRVYRDQGRVRLAAVVELVSPGNKDRPDNREAFVAKCVAYLQQQVSVVIVDVVTDRHGNLYADVAERLEFHRSARLVHAEESLLYAAAFRTIKDADGWYIDDWSVPLELGVELPTMPLWLAANVAVPVELESTYQETCRVLRMH